MVVVSSQLPSRAQGQLVCGMLLLSRLLFSYPAELVFEDLRDHVSPLFPTSSAVGVPIGVTKSSLMKAVPFLPVAKFSESFTLTNFASSPNGAFSSCSGIFSGVFGNLFPGVFGCSPLVFWFSGFEAAAC